MVKYNKNGIGINFAVDNVRNCSTCSNLEPSYKILWFNISAKCNALAGLKLNDINYGRCNCYDPNEEIVMMELEQKYKIKTTPKAIKRHDICISRNNDDTTFLASDAIMHSVMVANTYDHINNNGCLYDSNSYDSDCHSYSSDCSTSYSNYSDDSSSSCSCDCSSCD